MTLKSVKTRILLFAGLCLIGAVSVQVVSGLLSAQSANDLVVTRTSTILDDKTREAIGNLASTQAGLLRSEFETALIAARTMAQAFAHSAQASDGGHQPDKRQHLNDILLNVLTLNPRFNGTYSAWEPNALDGADESFHGRRETGTDATGRFLPYWNRDRAGRIAMQPLVEYDSAERHPNGVVKGGWYLGPKQTGKESVLGPLPYIVQGREVYLATLSVPIVAKGKFVGVAGADFDLDFVQKLAGEVSRAVFDGHNQVVILSDLGLVVAHSAHPELIGKSFAGESHSWEADLAVIRAGEASSRWQGDTLRTFAPIRLGETGKPWSVLIEVPRPVVMAQADQLRDSLLDRTRQNMIWSLVTSVVVLLAALGVMALAARGVAGPIIAMTRAMQRLADGDTAIEIPARDQQDEIGQMAHTVQVFKENALRVAALQEEQSRAEARATEERRQARHQLADSFEASVMGLVQAVAGSADQMQSTAVGMADSAREAGSRAETVASAAQSATANVETVATAAQALSDSIGEISRQVAQAAQVAQTASTEAARTSQMVEILAGAADRIGEVVNLINDIAAQTNLLALNATIEAARAGDAGKGFAVVAGEVKHLANQTAKATEEIGGQVSAVQEETRRAVAAIRTIAGVIDDVRQISASIAAAVEEQGAATREISRNVQQAAAGTRDVSTNIAGVNQAVGSTGAAANTVLDSARALSDNAGRLRAEVGSFLVTVRQ